MPLKGPPSKAVEADNIHTCTRIHVPVVIWKTTRLIILLLHLYSHPADIWTLDSKKIMSLSFPRHAP